jgi:hypothetical protein
MQNHLYNKVLHTICNNNKFCTFHNIQYKFYVCFIYNTVAIYRSIIQDSVIYCFYLADIIQPNSAQLDINIEITIAISL